MRGKGHTYSPLNIPNSLSSGEVRLGTEGRRNGDDLRTVNHVRRVLAEHRECLEDKLESVGEFVVVICEQRTVRRARVCG